MTDWVKACSTDSIGQGEMFSFDYNEKKLLNNDFNISPNSDRMGLRLINNSIKLILFMTSVLNIYIYYINSFVSKYRKVPKTKLYPWN